MQKTEILTIFPTKCWISIWGCGLLVAGTFLKIPCYPVSFTLQTLALFYFALRVSPKEACKASLLFLLLATLGFPVFAGHSNPFWLFGKCSGYLIAFPVAAAIASYFGSLKGLIFGHLTIYALGFIGLLSFVDPMTAFLKGIIIFLPSDIFKAALLYHGGKK